MRLVGLAVERGRIAGGEDQIGEAAGRLARRRAGAQAGDEVGMLLEDEEGAGTRLARGGEVGIAGKDARGVCWLSCVGRLPG